MIGLGYVGLPLMLATTAARFRVLGFDTDENRVRELNRGDSPLWHISQNAILSARTSGLFEATGEFDRLAEMDVVLICVPTPLSKEHQPDLSFVKATVREIATRIHPGQLVVLESTTYPGTTADVVRPALEEGGLKAGTDFFLAFSPEREDPGNAVYSTARIPRIVGADDPASLALALGFYGAVVDKVVPVSSSRAAEAVKITENVFRAVNVALANELKVIYEKMGLDVFEVVDAAKTKPFGYMPFYPGPGTGGHCIPVDPFYLAWSARRHGVDARFIALAGEINAEMPRYVVARAAEALDARKGRDLAGAKVLVVGVAYKRDVDDTRETPAFVVIELMRGRGAEVDYYDPLVGVVPKTRDHSGLADMRSIDFAAETIAAYDLVLVLTDHTAIDWQALVDAAQIVVDTRNIRARVRTGHDKIFTA